MSALRGYDFAVFDAIVVTLVPHKDRPKIVEALALLADARAKVDAEIDAEIARVRTPKPGTLLVRSYRTGTLAEPFVSRHKIVSVSKRHVTLSIHDRATKFRLLDGRSTGGGTWATAWQVIDDVELAALVAERGR